jgi:hypothetical protein
MLRIMPDKSFASNHLGMGGAIVQISQLASMPLWESESGKSERWFEARALRKHRQELDGFFCHRIFRHMTTGSQRSDETNKRDKLSSSRGKNAGVYLFGIVTKLRAAIQNRMPLGYEDEVGFHLGAKSSRGVLAKNEANQPQDNYSPGHRPE